LVEQRIRNAKVGGSTPLIGTIPSIRKALLRGPCRCCHVRVEY
jgi:hypothetical protein